jgi:hypothetical protein
MQNKCGRAARVMAVCALGLNACATDRLAPGRIDHRPLLRFSCKELTEELAIKKRELWYLGLERVDPLETMDPFGNARAREYWTKRRRLHAERNALKTASEIRCRKEMV